MTTKAATANGTSKEDAKYVALIDEDLARIDAVCKDIARRRPAGRKVQASIDRKLKEIRGILNRVEATL
jgi:hypothetical protein